MVSDGRLLIWLAASFSNVVMPCGLVRSATFTPLCQQGTRLSRRVLEPPNWAPTMWQRATSRAGRPALFATATACAMPTGVVLGLVLVPASGALRHAVPRPARLFGPTVLRIQPPLPAFWAPGGRFVVQSVRGFRVGNATGGGDGCRDGP